MIIDWKAAPEGTTHGMAVGLGEMRWYRVGEYVECWSVTIGWTQSFFLSKEEFEAAGLRLYEHGEQSELVMLREQRDALLAAAKELKAGYIRMLEAGRDRIRDFGGECDGIDVMVANDIELIAIDKAIAFVEGAK